MLVDPADAAVIVTSDVMSRSLAASVSGCGVARRRRSYMPGGTLIESGPGRAFASMIAARRVHAPDGVEAQIPSPGLASGSSFVLFTVNPAAEAGLMGPAHGATISAASSRSSA